MHSVAVTQKAKLGSGHRVLGGEWASTDGPGVLIAQEGEPAFLAMDLFRELVRSAKSGLLDKFLLDVVPGGDARDRRDVPEASVAAA